MYTHSFTLHIPQELWERLEKFCKRRGIADFIRQATEEKLDKVEAKIPSKIPNGICPS